MVGRLLRLGILLASVGAARATPADGEFHCYLVRPVQHALPAVVRGENPLTHDHADELLWTISKNRMEAAGHFVLAEMGCGTNCIRLASADLLTGNVRWVPETISSWPIKMLQPVLYRRDSRLVIVFGQLDERGSTEPFRYLHAPDGFHPIPDDQVCRKPHRTP